MPSNPSITAQTRSHSSQLCLHRLSVVSPVSLLAPLSHHSLPRYPSPLRHTPLRCFYSRLHEVCRFRPAYSSRSLALLSLGGQLHSDSTIIADTDNTSNTRHNSHLSSIIPQCLDSRRLPTSRPGRPSPSTTTSECSFNRANLRIELELTLSTGSVAPLC